MTELLGYLLRAEASLPLTGRALLPQELAVPALALGVAALAALLPAWEAYRSDALSLLHPL